MNDLKSLVALQARLYEFLEQQNEATLQAIVSGDVQLAVLGAREDGRIASSPAPSREPRQAAQDLSTLTSEHERRIYLNAAGLPVNGLKQVAKLCGLVGYSKLARAELVNALAVAHPMDGNSAAEQRAIPQDARPTGTAEPNAEVAAIASRLRETETEEAGAAYLQGQHLDRESLLAVAAELGLSRVNRLSQTELEKRVLKQAIVARRKFAGLRKW